MLKNSVIICAILIFSFGFGYFMTYHVGSEREILISITSPNEIGLIENGREPDITFLKLADTPYGEDIKLLKVSTHFVWDGQSNIYNHIAEWLSSIEVESYPDLAGN